MFEFKINFKNRTCYGDHYTVWYWDSVNRNYVTVLDKVYYANSNNEIINMIKSEVKRMFGIKRAKWDLNWK